METVIFDVFGDLALFRKFYTNTSILTYPFPPPTAAMGIIGAILGIEKNDLVNKLKDVEIAISIRSPVRKIRFSLNYINTKGRTFTLKQGRTQIPTEFVKNPYYRIYVRNLDKSLQSEFVTLLKEHRSIFVPYLGISEFFANFQFVSVEESDDFEGEESAASVVPLDKATVIPKKIGQKLIKERVPHVIDENRIVRKYTDVALDEEGDYVFIKGKFSKVGEESVIFFERFGSFLTSGKIS